VKLAGVEDALHLFAVPVAGVGQQHLAGLGDAGGSELPLGGSGIGSRCPKSARTVPLPSFIRPRAR
jgi:hypothetical protein